MKQKEFILIGILLKAKLTSFEFIFALAASEFAQEVKTNDNSTFTPAQFTKPVRPKILPLLQRERA